jgi:DNA-binding GntR family transcriptional regulator
MALDAQVQGRLPPGAKVAEAAVARELGISRAPVREAARLLEIVRIAPPRPDCAMRRRRLSTLLA